MPRRGPTGLIVAGVSAGAVVLALLAVLGVLALAAGDDAPGDASSTEDETSTTAAGQQPTTSLAAVPTAPVTGAEEPATSNLPLESIPPITPAPVPNPGPSPGGESETEIVASLVADGLQPDEARCVVDRAIAEFGSARGLVDPDVDPFVADRLFAMTQDCLFA